MSELDLDINFQNLNENLKGYNLNESFMMKVPQHSKFSFKKLLSEIN